MTTAERAQRNRQVIASLARGRRQAEIAAEHALTVRQVRRIAAEGQDALFDGDPTEEIAAAVAFLRQAIADMAVIEESPDNHAAHIGATRLKLQAHDRLLGLLAQIGVIPRQLGALGAERQMQEMFRELAAVAEEHDASDELVRALLSFAERRLTGVPAVIDAQARTA